MKNANFKLKKHDQGGQKFISCYDHADKCIGVVYNYCEYVPVQDVELSYSELKSIIAIMDNFMTFFDNIKD